MSANPLGEQVANPNGYDPGVLFAIPRQAARSRLNLDAGVPMHGLDHWNAYEMSWLNQRGKPQVALGELFFSADSQNIVESKSLKLYLNSLNQERFSDRRSLIEVMEKDLAAVSKSPVKILLTDVNRATAETSARRGESLDLQDISVEVFQPEADLLEVSQHRVADAALYSHLFRSTCPVTGQPDWASVEIRYSGNRLDAACLLQYLCSYREHQGYHEECCERIYRDLFKAVAPKQLFIAMNFLRRGGLDINVYRSSDPVDTGQILPRTLRQ